MLYSPSPTAASARLVGPGTLVGMDARDALETTVGTGTADGSLACCGTAPVPGARFCTQCGTPLASATTAWVAPEGPHPDEERVTAVTERELLRALRDIDDGHIGLYGTPEDAQPDRIVSAPLSRLDWVGVMVARGWVAPPPWGGLQALVITEEGRAVLAQRWSGWRNTSTSS